MKSYIHIQEESLFHRDKVKQMTWLQRKQTHMSQPKSRGWF